MYTWEHEVYMVLGDTCECASMWCVCVCECTCDSQCLPRWISIEAALSLNPEITSLDSQLTSLLPASPVCLRFPLDYRQGQHFTSRVIFPTHRALLMLEGGKGFYSMSSQQICPKLLSQARWHMRSGVLALCLAFQQGNGA